jgi:putative peptidoglycan lipid II flippase
VITQSEPAVHQKNPKNEVSHEAMVAQRAIFMASGTLVSRILGLLRDMALASFFPKTVTDAFGVAFRLPNLFRRLMGEGSISASFIPIFIQLQGGSQGELRSRQLLNQLTTLLWLVLLTATAWGVLQARDLTTLLVGPHFDSIKDKFELTVSMTRIMLGFVFLVSTAGLFSSVLQALGFFGIPALAPAIFNCVLILANFWPRWFGYSEQLFLSGKTLAWGVLLGGICQVLLLFVLMTRQGLWPRLTWPRWTGDLKQVMKNLIPGLCGGGLLQFLGIINTRAAAGLGEGANTFLYLADRLLELPLTLISVSLGAALLPTLSEHWAQRNHQKLKATAASALGLNLFISVPAAAGLLALAHPIVTVLFRHGNFSDSEALITAHVLQVSAATLLFSSLSRVMMPLFFAMQNTWLPALTTVLAMVWHLCSLSWWTQRWGLVGVAAATATSLLVQALSLALLLERRERLFPWRTLGQSFLRFGLLCLPILMLGFGMHGLWDSLGKSLKMLVLAALLLLSAGLYLGLARLWRVSEFQLLLSVKRNKRS